MAEIGALVLDAGNCCQITRPSGESFQVPWEDVASRGNGTYALRPTARIQSVSTKRTGREEKRPVHIPETVLNRLPKG